MSASDQTRIVDLSTYAVRLLRQWLRALPAALVVGILGLVWSLLVPPSYEATAALFVQLPRVQSEAEATQQSIFASQLAAADLTITQNSPQIAELVTAKHPDLDARSLRDTVTFQSKGLALTVTAAGETPEEAVALANDTAEAFTTVMGDLKSDAQPVLAFNYQLGAPASLDLTDTVSGKMPRLIITLAATVVVWILTMVILDGRTQRKRLGATAVEGRH